MLNIEIEVAKQQQVIDDEDKLVEKMLENNLMTSTGQWFKLGAQVANAAVVTRAGQKKIEQMEMKQVEKMETKTKKEIAAKVEKIDAFKKFLEAGKPSQMSAKDSKAILKFVLPLLAPSEKMSEYNMGPKAMERLVKFGMDSGNKVTWISEMEKYTDKEEINQEGAV